MDIIKYLNVPYKHHGRDYTGCDCLGLVKLVYEAELGIILPDVPLTYSEEWWTEQDYIAEWYQKFGFTETSKCQPWDIITFKNTNTVAGHMGVVIDDSSFLHMTLSGAATSNYLYGPWARQLDTRYSYSKNDN